MSSWEELSSALSISSSFAELKSERASWMPSMLVRILLLDSIKKEPLERISAAMDLGGGVLLQRYYYWVSVGNNLSARSKSTLAALSKGSFEIALEDSDTVILIGIASVELMGGIAKLSDCKDYAGESA